MTRDEITRMAQEARLIKAGDGWAEPHRWALAMPKEKNRGAA